MNELLNALLTAICGCGVIMNKSELLELALGEYGFTEYIEDADGNIVDSHRAYDRKTLQEIADVFTDGFDCINY